MVDITSKEFADLPEEEKVQAMVDSGFAADERRARAFLARGKGGLGDERPPTEAMRQRRREAGRAGQARGGRFGLSPDGRA